MSPELTVFDFNLVTARILRKYQLGHLIDRMNNIELINKELDTFEERQKALFLYVPEEITWLQSMYRN